MFKFFLLFLWLIFSPNKVAAEFRDPTIPGNLPKPQEHTPTPVAPQTELKLNSIWVSANSRRAVIDGITYKTGQALADSSRIIKIESRYVLIKNHMHVKKLFLVPSVKHQVK